MRVASSSNRRLLVASLALATTTACGGDFRTTSGGKDSGVSSTGGVASGGSRSIDGGSASGGAQSGGAASTGGHGGSGSGGTTSGGSGGASSGGNSSAGGASTGSGGMGTGGSSAGGSGHSGGSGAGGVGSGGKGSGGASSGGASSGGTSGSGGHSQFVKDYDLKCAYDTDCSLVYEGSDVCSCDAQCVNASISSSALAQWDADRQAMHCVALPCAKQTCPSLVASCGSSACYARKPLLIDAKNYDQSCLTVADCTTIFTGEVCSPCQCARGAVSNKGYQQYMKDKQSVSCTPPPVGCDCALQPSTLSCVLAVSGSGVGTCTLSATTTTN